MFLYSIACMKNLFQIIKPFQEGQKITAQELVVVCSPDGILIYFKIKGKACFNQANFTSL